jgi:iron complex outermembrane recepter protein
MTGMLPLMLLAAAAPAATTAAPPRAVPVQAMPVQVVTARATAPRPFDLPAAVDVIDLTAPGRDVPGIGARRALRGVPGLAVGERQNLAQDAPVSIRGFGARAAFGIRGVRLVVDGIPATTPDGQGQLSHAMFGAAERIEVLRGPFTALYANAAGGLIRVSTAAGDTPARQRVELGGGSHGVVHAEAGASGEAGAFGYNLNLDRTHVDGQRGHARADRSGADLRLDWRPARASAGPWP